MTKQNECLRIYLNKKGFIPDKSSMSYTRIFPKLNLTVNVNLDTKTLNLIYPNKEYNTLVQASAGKNVVIEYTWGDNIDEAIYNINSLIQETVDKLSKE